MPAKRGWPKGKPRGPMSPGHKKKFVKAGALAARQRKVRIAEIASGMDLGGKEHIVRGGQAGTIMATPAMWLSATHHVADFAYIEDGCDAALLRAVSTGIVYASRGGHQEPPFQDVTISAMAAVDRAARKAGIPMRPLLLPARNSRKVEPVKQPEKHDLWTPRRLQMVSLIAAGLTFEEIGATLSISPRTAKMHSDALRLILGVERARDIPVAFYRLTGKDVFAYMPDVYALEPVRETPKPSSGMSLLEVVSEMFDS